MDLDRRTFCTAMAVGAATLSADEAWAIGKPKVRARNVVLVHGLYADGSSWLDVIVRLQAQGLNVTSVQHPLTTLPDAVDACRRVLDRQDGPTVLAGHSFGGMIVTEAGLHAKVAALVYAAARAPDANEDFAALAKRFAPTPASAGVIFDGDEGRLREDAFMRDFAPDIAVDRARALFAAQWPFHKALQLGRTTQAAWRSKPSFYAVSRDDRVIDPELQRFMAHRMGARTVELPSSHVSILSHPEEISRMILDAAG